MLQRFIDRMKQPAYRKLFGVMLASKLLGVTVLLAAMWAMRWYFATPAMADEAAAAPPAYVNPMNTMWTVMAAFLVFFMQAGFMMLEAGFSRTRETINVLLEGLAHLYEAAPLQARTVPCPAAVLEDRARSWLQAIAR